MGGAERRPFFNDGFSKSFIQGINSEASLGIAVFFGKQVLFRTFLRDQVAYGHAKEPYRIAQGVPTGQELDAFHDFFIQLQGQVGGKASRMDLEIRCLHL